ncbi:hypothetical protein [Comamonas sp. GB3 AK4-5]|uniref:hypothetical protein n=1 Tax=Comamonas sp. GB3 AK4-5 TaxID=3231487 RepID=UPI00351E4516
MSTRNPEFQRQIWLNWHPSLLAWSLGLTLLLLALPLALSSAEELPDSLKNTAITGLWLASCLYGSILAGRSLTEEATHNTWDWQRLSALSPWQMAWGKLLGAALPAWLYVLWFAAAIAGIYSIWHFEGLGLNAAHVIGMAMLWGLGAQAWAMNAVLMSWGQQDLPANRKRVVFLPLLLLSFMSGPIFDGTYGAVFNHDADAVNWWGMEVGSLGVVYLTGGLVLGLGLLGLWRLLCTRLDVRTLPWAWPLGIVLSGFVLSGVQHADALTLLTKTGWIAVLATVYIALQHMDQHLRAWRQVQWSASQGRWREMLEALPLWPVSLLLGMLISIAALLIPASDEISSSQVLGRFSILIHLQLLRDCLLLTGFALLAGKLKSPMLSFVIAWLILNIVAPLLAYGIADFSGAMLLQPVLAVRFFIDAIEPLSPWQQYAPWASLGLQTLLVLGWVLHIFKDRVLGFAQDHSAAKV